MAMISVILPARPIRVYTDLYRKAAGSYVSLHIKPERLIILSRRRFCAAVTTAAFLRPQILFAAQTSTVPSSLVERARAALDQHARRGLQHEVVGIVDFSAPSHEPRFHLVDLVSARTTTILVAHGRGSDPGHSGWLRQFSNDVGSNASSEGSYLSADIYAGHHGPSRRLIGLDDSNDRARERGIVIHAADYVSLDLAQNAGKIGRSEGCLAVSRPDLSMVLQRLGPNCLIYAGKS